MVLYTCLQERDPRSLAYMCSSTLLAMKLIKIGKGNFGAVADREDYQF